ncbi:MAG: hypothetical protein R3229_09950 [Alphaproteobacteria bacterium]|nr:hypothetical protein [Alphaproteobacteria bacterium]
MQVSSAIRDEGRFAIFAALFGLYLVAHHFYLFNGLALDRAGPMIVMLPGAFLLMLWPFSLPLFVFMSALHLAQTLMALPRGSNHMIMSLFLMLGLVAAYLHVAVRDRQFAVGTSRYFDTFAPLGRWLLIIMYFYGTLHKVNTDFLNPLTSCAVAMWRRFGFPEFIAESSAVHTMTMYGTLVVEATAIILLLTRRFRWWGIVIGVSFHGFLGFLPPGRIIAYSLLSIVLHSLFLPKDALARLAGGALGRRLAPLVATPARRAAVILAAMAAALVLPWAVTWGLLLAAILAFVATYGREPQAEDAGRRRWLISGSAAVNLLAVVFFLNGASPYLGFKTGQTIAMFSNLITEGGRSNHLIVPNLRLFDHQYRVATVRDTNVPLLAAWSRQGFKLVEFQVLDYLERTPGARAEFEVDGTTYTHSADNPLPAVSNLPPRWLRNLMVFRPVVLESPRKCDSY